MAGTVRRLVRAMMAVVALAACTSESDKNAAATPDSAAAATSPAASTGPALTEPQIAMVALVASSADSAGGIQAQERSANPDVRNFAQTMITDHTNMNREATDLTTRLQVTPEVSDMSRQIKESHDRASADLSTKTGPEFERAYIQHEVAMHESVLNALDQRLIPGAQNAELKTLLQKVRPAVQAHLERAKQIQQRLAAAAAPTARTTTTGM
jgi:putative membrane protein